MSILRLDVQRVLYVLRISGKVIGTWPPSPEAGTGELLLRDLLLCFAVLNVLGLAIPLILSVFHNGSDIVGMMKALSELTTLAELFFNLILCRLGRAKLQRLLKTAEDFFHSLNERENVVVQKYIDRYLRYSIFVALTDSLAAVAFSCGPLFLSVEFPAEGWYPFSTQPPARRFLIYSLQVVAIWQTAIGCTVDFMVAMLFWFSTAKLDMLVSEVERVKNVGQMKLCIEKHQEIIKFVEETQNVIRYLILKTNCTAACSIIFGAFPLVYNQPAAIMAQFIFMVIVSCQRLYVTVWPADDLYQISQHIAFSAYSAEWIGESPELSANVLVMMQRSQKPLEIQVAGLCVTFSLEYYSSFLKTVSSWFMTMRAAIDN